jgi:hypothetical protein
VPTAGPSPFGRDRWQEDLHAGLQDQFWRLLKNRGEAKSPRVEQLITLFFLGEIRRGWLIGALSEDHAMDYLQATSLVEAAYQSWRRDPDIKWAFNKIMKVPVFWTEE